MFDVSGESLEDLVSIDADLLCSVTVGLRGSRLMLSDDGFVQLNASFDRFRTCNLTLVWSKLLHPEFARFARIALKTAKNKSHRDV